MVTRRKFVELSVLSGGMALLEGCRCPFGGAAERVPYGETIGDRLWMWGHHRDSFAALKGQHEQYNLPYDTRIDMAAACKEMGIPGCFVVRWRNLPRKEDLSAYMEQFGDTKRVGFSITDSASERFEEKVRLGLELADRMPNLTTFVMDDFWSGCGKGLGLGEIAAVADRLHARGMKLGVVLYSDTNDITPEFKDVLDLCDEIMYWFWNGKNVVSIEENVAKLRAFAGADKPILLGQYMYDFGGKRPLSAALMETQLAQASRLLERREIHGLIFHCTPLVDMNLDAVNVSRNWIAEHAQKKWGR